MRTIGVTYDTAADAEAALQTARWLEAKGLLQIHDAALVTWDAQGRPDATPPAFAVEMPALMELAKPGQVVLALHVTDIAGMIVIEELRRFRNKRVLYV